MTKTLVLFSGGQDSATVLAWALKTYDTVETVGFDYGQKHAVEMTVRKDLRAAIAACQPAWVARLGADHEISVDITDQLAQLPHTLTPPGKYVPEYASGDRYILGRNLLFLTLAANVAFRRGITQLAAGMSEAEYSGYPDCRADTVEAMTKAINACTESTLTINCPLMKLTKAGVWLLAETLGGQNLVEIIRTGTHTCYEGQRDYLNAWGYGCGYCPACRLRARGWNDFQARTTN